MSTLGLNLLSKIIEGGESYTSFRLSGIDDKYFSSEELKVYKFVTAFTSKHGVPPKPKLIKEKTGVALTKQSEPFSFLAEEVKKRFIQRELKHAGQRLSETLTDNDPIKGLSELREKVLELTIEDKSDSIVDIASSHGSELFKQDYVLKNANQNYITTTGWKGLDDKIGGIFPTDFISITADTSMGKTYLMCILALHLMNQGKSPCLVSMEMPPIQLMHRVLALAKKINPNHLKMGELSTAELKKVESWMTEATANGVPFWVVDGNFNTGMEDIQALASQLRPGAMMIDGAYLVRHPNNRLATWERIKAVTEYFKQSIAGQLHIPTIGTYQLTKEGSKKKGVKNKSVTVHDTGGGVAIGQTATVALGMFEEQDMVSSLVRRRIEIMKNREGGKDHYFINWDFVKMDFSEAKTEAHELENL